MFTTTKISMHFPDPKPFSPIRAKSAQLQSARYTKLYTLYRARAKMTAINAVDDQDQLQRSSSIQPIRFSRHSYRVITHRDDNFFQEQYNQLQFRPTKFEEVIRRRFLSIFSQGQQHGEAFAKLQSNISGSITQYYKQLVIDAKRAELQKITADLLQQKKSFKRPEKSQTILSMQDPHSKMSVQERLQSIRQKKRIQSAAVIKTKDTESMVDYEFDSKRQDWIV